MNSNNGWINKQAGRVKLYAGGFGSDKERRAVLRNAPLDSLEMALVWAKEDNGVFFRKQLCIQNIEREIKRRQTFTGQE